MFGRNDRRQRQVEREREVRERKKNGAEIKKKIWKKRELRKSGT
jgi:hypothetical protein